MKTQSLLCSRDYLLNCSVTLSDGELRTLKPHTHMKMCLEQNLLFDSRKLSKYFLM